MKKIALILVTVVYMLSTFGIAVSEFYCCGKLKSISISFNDEKQKDCKKAADNGGCCKTTHQYFKIKDTHIVSDAVSLSAKFFSIIHTDFPSFEISNTANGKNIISYTINAPPIHPGTPVYIFNCIYRI